MHGPVLGLTLHIPLDLFFLFNISYCARCVGGVLSIDFPSGSQDTSSVSDTAIGLDGPVKLVFYPAYFGDHKPCLGTSVPMDFAGTIWP